MSVVAPPSVSNAYSIGSKKASRSSLGLGKFKKPPNNPFLKGSALDAKNRINQPNTAQELEFFDRVKRALNNKTTYVEFLKVINLYNQDIINAKTLIDKVEPFIGKHQELYDWFRYYVGHGEETELLVTPHNSQGQPRDLSESKRSGASYRMLPVTYV